MSRQRIGQMLSRMGRLSELDVYEILEEQNLTHRRFGQIALEWGLCEPQHIWRVWCEQAADAKGAIDLAAVGVDAQATTCLPREVAARLGVVPIRQLEDYFVVAHRPGLDEPGQREVRSFLGDHVVFVCAEPDHVAQAIAEYYPLLPRPSNS